MKGLTPTRSLLPVAVSAGSGATDGVHVPPDRVSTSRPVPPALVRYIPSATHEPRAGHDTPASSTSLLVLASDTCGASVAVHCPPERVSMSPATVTGPVA